MKNIIAFALLFSLTAGAQTSEKACDVLSKINNVLQTRHIAPKPIDDSLSVYVFNTVMEELDENHILFLQEDYDRLSKHKYKIDDHLKNRNCAFFDEFTTVYSNALQRHKSIVEGLIAQNLPYNTTDTIFYSKKAFPYNKEIKTSAGFIRKKMIYDILEDVAKQSKDIDSLKSKLPELAKASKDKISETYLCRVNALLNPGESLESDLYNKFYSAFCAYFDPHSTYFNYDEKASFVSTISSENYTLGIYVSQNEKEEIIVEEIIPGGPAYKTYKIDKGDQILKLAANDIEYAVSCASMEAINDIVFSDTYRNVELTLRKKDGTIYSVVLEKKVMKSDSHTAYSYMIGGNSKIGYLKIPSFYSAFDDTNMKGCAEDVAWEVLKLKDEGMKGLIIDLQYNGGGSMDEVISMAGMFINYGPIVVINDKDNFTNVIKDYNRGMLFDGPIIILVNGLSASASEFFAGVLQDYNRAVIVGNTTMGKASMQTILPLSEAMDNRDFVKVSIDKFYRVTGKSSQYTGIIPDVEIPSVFDDLMPRENSMATAMKNDSLDIKLKFKPMDKTAMLKAISASKQRIANDDNFRNINAINKELSTLYDSDKKPLPVTFENVFNDVHSMDVLWTKIALATSQKNGLTVENTFDLASIPGNEEFYKSMDEFKINAIKTDPAIKEGVNILTDLTATPSN